MSKNQEKTPFIKAPKIQIKMYATKKFSKNKIDIKVERSKWRIIPCLQIRELH